MNDASIAWATGQIQMASSILSKLPRAQPDEIEQALTALNNARSVFTHEHVRTEWAELALDRAWLTCAEQRGDGLRI